MSKKKDILMDAPDDVAKTTITNSGLPSEVLEDYLIKAMSTLNLALKTSVFVSHNIVDGDTKIAASQIDSMKEGLLSIIPTLLISIAGAVGEERVDKIKEMLDDLEKLGASLVEEKTNRQDDYYEKLHGAKFKQA